MSKRNARLSVVRPMFLAVALLLAVAAMISPALAACTPGATRTVIVNPDCCSLSPTKAWKQNQVCSSGGFWLNNGSSYCGSVPTCAI